MAVVQNMAPGALAGVAGLAQAFVGAPAWMVVVCLGLSLSLGALQVVFPQESADKLSWWRNRRAFLARRKHLGNVRARERRQARLRWRNRRPGNG
ncbi:hypothetical protein [Streptomyces sp. NPDC050585]|uniref:hypothetical protein n=1 Tax=Streptomyces sp. NPDC050585 TaxID=3365632 RepID=UPI0037AF7AC7